MADYSHIYFNKSPLQLRLIGARGGKARVRNLRARRALLPTPPAAVPLPGIPGQTAAEAVAVLDAQFPWLRRAEQRITRSQPPRSLPAAPPRRARRSKGSKEWTSRA
jgi:hypothetical protein